tara:strand:- start:1142 stop:1582 length:441 start_codon:yes stop_codon:yes gene_type:complete
MESHPTKEVTLGKCDFITANIDEEIVPLIEWFNQMPGLKTKYSCQGDNEGLEPNVSFQVASLEPLIIVRNLLSLYYVNATKLPGNISFEVMYHVGIGSQGIFFNIRFPTKSHILDFYDFVKDIKIRFSTNGGELFPSNITREKQSD